MLNGMLGRKIGMTQFFTEAGERVPVTVVEVGPLTVVQVKTMETDGYEGVQVGFMPIKKEKNINKPTKGHFKDVKPTQFLREFKADDISKMKPGLVIDLSMFKEGEVINVAGTSKGKGFQGVVKRHHFSGGPDTHGSNFHRRPGSIGNRKFPGRTFPGKRMGGHMGAERVTVRNLVIAKIVPEKNLILIRGSTPGHNGAVVELLKPKSSPKA
ncbi:MAG TPA: 50S ribosomal protein L3 [bacterium]